jgi:hypothetical protein
MLPDVALRKKEGRSLTTRRKPPILRVEDIYSDGPRLHNAIPVLFSATTQLLGSPLRNLRQCA